jgi:hypothetical protein
MAKFTICVTQMVEQIGTFTVEADTLADAERIARTKDLFDECEAAGSWESGDYAEKARIWAIGDADGKLMSEF